MIYDARCIGCGRCVMICPHHAFSVKSDTLEELKKYPSDEIFIIGGGSIYKMMLPYCHKAVITRIDYAYEADAHFPDLEAEPDWVIEEEGEEETCFSIEYRYETYRNLSPLPLG